MVCEITVAKEESIQNAITDDVEVFHEKCHMQDALNYMEDIFRYSKLQIYQNNYSW